MNRITNSERKELKTGFEKILKHMDKISEFERGYIVGHGDALEQLYGGKANDGNTSEQKRGSY